jgi:hypothetical protein
MLIQLLQLLITGTVHSPADIAQRMGIRIEMVSELLRQLERLGYLETQDPSCASGGCSHCDIRGGCQTNARIWSLTAKGQRAASAR